MIDFQKSLKVAMIPAGILIALGIVSTVIVHFVALLICIVGLPLAIASWVVNAWAGYKSVKEEGMDLTGGAVTGAIAGAIAGFVNAIISFVFNVAGFASSADTTGMAIGGAIGIVAIIVAPIVGAVIGAILGAIGAYLAGMKNTPAPAAAPKK